MKEMILEAIKILEENCIRCECVASVAQIFWESLNERYAEEDVTYPNVSFYLCEETAKTARMTNDLIDLLNRMLKEGKGVAA